MKAYKNWNTIELVMLGGGGVGKSAITVRFVSNHFVQIYDPTIEDSYRTSRNIDGENFQLSILDTAGQEEYSALRDQYVRQGEGFILVMSITSQASLIDVSNMRDSIYMILDAEKTEYIPIYLCANKKDLEEQREIPDDDIKQFALNWNVKYKYVSAKTGEGVNEMFDEFAREILEHRIKPSDTKKSNNKEITTRNRSDSKLKCIML